MDLIAQFDYYQSQLDNCIQDVAASECKLSLELEKMPMDHDTKVLVSVLQVHVRNLQNAARTGLQFRENMNTQSLVNTADYLNRLHVD